MTACRQVNELLISKLPYMLFGTKNLPVATDFFFKKAATSTPNWEFFAGTFYDEMYQICVCQCCWKAPIVIWIDKLFYNKLSEKKLEATIDQQSTWPPRGQQSTNKLKLETTHKQCWCSLKIQNIRLHQIKLWKVEILIHQNKNQIGNQSGQGQNGQNTGLQNILPSQDAGVPDLLVVAGDVSYGYRPYLYFPHFGRQPRPVLGAKHPDDKKLD